MIVITDLRQRHIEAVMKHLRENGIEPAKMSAPEYAGGVVRAAAFAGMIEGLTVEAVDDLLPGKVVYLAGQVSGLIGTALEPDPN